MAAAGYDPSRADGMAKPDGDFVSINLAGLDDVETQVRCFRCASATVATTIE